MTHRLMITRRSLTRIVLALVGAILLATGGAYRPTVEAQGNPIVAENLAQGDNTWDISGAGDPDIQGFATDISVNVGQTVRFKIAAPGSSNYSIKIYRLGYYNGDGAREITTVTPSATLPQTQPACNNSQFTTTGLVDCGNWAESASWAVPATAVSGIYIAKPIRADNNHSSHIIFIVRDDNRTADIVFQTSDTTWQAYNQYPGVNNGGASLYCGGPVSNAGTAYACQGRATKVSYNRPFDTRAHDAQSFLFSAEYPMVRWLEANGYNVKYQAGVDTDRRGFDLTGLHKPRVFLSVGHDEYWSGAQRTAVTNARNAGVNLAFFSGNEMYWKTRWEPGFAGTAYRTLVTYKETLASAKIDPAVDPVTGVPIWTGTWRDPRFSPPADGGRPENGLIGQIWTVNCCSDAIRVPAEMGNQRFWRNTRVAQLAPGTVATMSNNTLGYEWDEDLDNGHRPAGMIRLSLTTLPVAEKLTDFGSHVGPGNATHALTMYRHNSGALVFGAGTVQWSWGLDSIHDGAVSTPDQAMQQGTVNLFTDMGVAPGSLMVGADPTRPINTTTASSDMLAPVSAIASPAPGASVPSGSRLTISGSASDLGGGAVAGVEVSVDGGTTWHPAHGSSTWSYDWTPGSLGNAVIRTRAIDDSGNLESAGPGIMVNVIQGDCPCTSLWKPSAVPPIPDFGDGTALELGVKFKSDIDGFITGIRYYKSVANSGTHVGNLWKTDGTQLATATFSGETQSGWQQVLFATPVAITANTVYVASYHTNVGHYAATPGYFNTASVDSPPLHALPTNSVGGNGVFAVGDSAFPSNTFNGANYWVDVVFATSTVDSTPPVITNLRSTTIDSSKVQVSWGTDEASTSKLEYSTDFSFPAANTAVINETSFSTSHSVTVPNLTPNTTYYYRVTATDATGNSAMSASPSFTVPGPTLRDTAIADFEAGTHQNTYPSMTFDGEAILSPAAGSEFSGPGLSPGWIAVPWGPGGFSLIDSGVLIVDGARVATCALVNGQCAPEDTQSTQSATFTAPRTLEFSARFSGDQFQHAGLGVTFSSGSEPWAIFSTLSGGALFARTNTGTAGSIDTFIGAGLLGQFHRYRIDWTPTAVNYFVDGVPVASHPLTVTTPMRPVAASDFNVFGGDVFVDWMRLTPYPGAGMFVSRIFDATELVDWRAIQWQSTVPAGTTLAISVRTGNVPVPDDTWTEFVPVASSGPMSVQSRYIQYRASMTTNDAGLTPALEDIIITTGHAPVANADAAVVKENGVHTFPASGPGSLIANDTDADTNDLLRVTAVTPAGHGIVVLNADGTITYTPAVNYSGPDAFSYTVSDGLLTASAPVTLDVRFGNVAPAANADFYTTDEEAVLSVPAGVGVLANDTDVENDTLSAILVSVPLHGQLTFGANGSFTYTPAPNYAGPDSFQYKASDSAEQSNVATVNILVNQVNDAPITEADAYTAVLNQPLDVLAAFSAGAGRYISGVLANDHDVEVEDTTPMHAVLVSNVTHGTLTLNSDGSFSYLPAADYLGTDSFTYRAADHFNALGNIATVTITIATKAVSQSVTGGTTLSTGNGVSAADPLQSAVTSPAAATVSIAQGVISAGQSPQGYTFLNQQVNITVTGADGLEVTAAASNPIRLTFTVDGTLIPEGQSPATFQMFRNGVLIPECPGATSIPAANSDPCVSTRQDLGGAARLTILTTHASRWNMGLSTALLGDSPVARDDAFPVDFQAPIVRPAPGVLGNDYGKDSLTAVLVGTPEGGSVTLAPSGAFTFTPETGFCGIANFTYQAFDGALESNLGTVRLTVDCTPRPGDDTITVLEDSGTSVITVLSNDTDPDPGQTLKVIEVTQAAHGVVAIIGNGMALSYTPQPDYFGADSFTYTVSDGHNGSATATVSVTVKAVNDVPRFIKGADQVVDESAGPQSVGGWATGLSAGPANEAGQALTFLVSSSNPALFSGQPSVSSDGTLTFTPAAGVNGSASVSVRIADNGGVADGGVDTSAAQTFAISVRPVNSNPVAAAVSVSALQGSTTAIVLSGTDVETPASALSFTVSTPSHGTLTGTAPNVTYKPTPGYVGPDSFTYTVTDRGDPDNCGAPGTLCAASMTSAAATVSILVKKTDSTTTLAASNVSPVYGSAITLTATVTPVPAGSLVPSGTVTFTDGAVTLGSSAVSGGVATLTTSALAAGSHAITAAYSGDVNLNDSNGSVSVNVQPKALTAKADNKTKVFGAANPVLTVTYTGFVNGDTAASLATQATLSTTATDASPVGSYPITVSGAASPNYTISFVSGTLTVTPVPTTTALASSSNPILAGVPLKLTATVTPAAPSTAIAAGTVTFKNGTTTLGSAALASGVATLTIATLPVGTHSLTAVYAGNPSLGASTSSALSQVVQPSSTLKVSFSVHALQDTTSKPKVKTIGVPNAIVKVYTTGTPCSGNLLSIINPKKWGVIYDGSDGPGGVDGCDPITVGSYEAEATTDALGNATIIVPPLSASLSSQYLVIGRALNFDYVQTATSSDPLYSQSPVVQVSANAQKNVSLSLLATFNGKIVPGAQAEFLGSYLNVIQPEYMDWTEDQELYPFVLVAQGDWSVTTGVTPPEGFVADTPILSTQAADATTAIQFTMTDIGSEWTETQVNHSLVHLGTTSTTSSAIPMIDKKVTLARNDSVKVMHDDSAVFTPLANDRVNHMRKPLVITTIGSALNGIAVLSQDGLSVAYTPNAGFSGTDSFTYTLRDAIGDTSTATVNVTVLPTPEVSVRSISVPEGDSGASNPAVNVVLSNQSLLPVTVSYAMASDSAVAGADFGQVTGSVTFAPGETSKPIALSILGDTLAEDHEKFSVVLASPVNAVIAANPGGLITISDDDPPEVTIAAGASMVERNTGVDNVPIVVSLSQTHPESVWVTYTTSPGTATAGSDYIHTAATVQFLPGTLTKTIYIPIKGDTAGEPSETFYVDLSNPLNGTLTADRRATVTIVNDDNSTEVFSTAADLSGGTLAGGAVMTETENGEVSLATLQSSEFSGGALDAGWTGSAIVAGGSTAVSGGRVALDGAAVSGPVATTATGQTIEMTATFTAANQSIGFAGAPALSSPMAMFTIRGTTLYARSMMGTKIVENVMAGIDWKNKVHKYQITLTAQNASYYIDGNLMVAHTSMAWGTASLRPTIMDATLGDPALSVDWVRSGPFAASGSYTSAVFDGGEQVTWVKVTSTNSIAPWFSCCATSGTTNVMSYRMGDTPTPDASWTAFAPVGTGGTVTGSSRYIQYMFAMTSTAGTKAPIVQDVTITYKRP